MIKRLWKDRYIILIELVIAGVLAWTLFCMTEIVYESSFIENYYSDINLIAKMLKLF